MDRPEEDARLVDRLAAGETSALEALYDRYAGVVFALVLRVVADRQIAEELLQEVFLRAWQHAKSYQSSRGRVLTWLLGIARNLAIDELRRRRRRPQAPPERERQDTDRLLASLPAHGTAPDEEVWATIRRAQVGAALDRLPSAQRAIIELAYFEGHTQSEIAARLGQPLGTVKTRMRLGMHKLRDILQTQGLELNVD